MSRTILLLPGDGIGPEVTAQAHRVLLAVLQNAEVDITSADIGGVAIDNSGSPLPPSTVAAVNNADAVLLGAVGAPRYDGLPSEQKPEKGLLDLRRQLAVFANLRPAICHAELVGASSLKPALVRGLDLLIVRELTGGIYFGTPRGVAAENGVRVGFNTMRYDENEIARIAHRAFAAARQRRRRLCSVDKANVLEVSLLWRERVTAIGAEEYPDVELSHMYVDNAAMQLVREPKQFDVIVTGNLFGDILSDAAAMLTGSIGMLPSASLAADGRGLYEPVHGSAPDIAGRDMANPLAAILSAAMLLRHSLDMPAAAAAVEDAVRRTLADGCRTADIADNGNVVGCREMTNNVLKHLQT